MYGTIVRLAAVGGVLFALYGSSARLTGFWDNGLRWNIPQYEVKKFDTTSRFEDNTIWKRFRIKLD